MAFDLAGTISQSLGSVPQQMLQQQQQGRVQGDLQRIMQAVLPDKKRAAQERLDRLKSNARDMGQRVDRGRFAPIGMEELGTDDELAISRAERGNVETDLARALQNVQTPEGLELGMGLFERAQQQSAERSLAREEAMLGQQEMAAEQQYDLQKSQFEHQQDLQKVGLEASLREPDTFSRPRALRHPETGETQTFINKARASQFAQQGWQLADDESGGRLEPKDHQKEAQMLQRQMADLRAGKDIPAAWGKDRDTAISNLKKARDIHLDVASGRLDPNAANERLSELGAPSTDRTAGRDQQQEGRGQQTRVMDKPPAPEDLEGIANIQDYEKSMGFGNMLKRVTQESLGWAVPGTLFKEEAMSANKVRYMNQRLRDKLKVSQYGARWDMKEIDRMLPTPSAFTDPDTARDRVQTLYDNVDQMLGEKEKFLKREGVSKSAINQVQKDIQKLQEVRSALPNPREESAQDTADDELSNRISEVPADELRSADIGTIEQLVDRYGSKKLLNSMNSDQKQALRERIREQRGEE